ncbi:MAG: winged helix-turn-helix domain-containing protein [Nitrososphaeraceae archaeon]
MTKTFSDRKNHGFPTRRIAQIRYIKFKISKSRTSKDFINHLRVHVYRLLHKWKFSPKVPRKRFVNAASNEEMKQFKKRVRK